MLRRATLPTSGLLCLSAMVWASRIRKVAAVALILWIIFVVIAPNIDLPTSTMRTQTALALLAFAFIVYELSLRPRPCPLHLQRVLRVRCKLTHDLFDLTCVRLC